MNTPHDDIIVSFTQGLVDAVLSAVGRDGVASVFAGGSAAVGELSYCEVDGRLEIYSDVDLYVVLEDGADAEQARAAARAGGQEDRLGYLVAKQPLDARL